MRTSPNRLPVIALVVVTVLACSDSPTGAPLPTTQEVVADSIELAPGGEATAGDLRLSFTEVTDDSRCPVDVTCIWVGTAAVHIGVAVGMDPSAARVLNTYDAAPVDFSGYRITLLQLLPGPLAGVPIPPQDYRASFRIERLTATGLQ